MYLLYTRSCTTSYPKFSLMEHRITVRNRWKTRTHQASLTRLFDSNYFPSTADCRAATSPNFRKPRIFLFFLLSRTVRGLPALLVYSWLACCLPLPRKPRINFSRSFSTLTLFIALRLTHTHARAFRFVPLLSFENV